jgi:thiosulfate/3-mercaptopyruvate sulfurtransferase
MMQRRIILLGAAICTQWCGSVWNGAAFAAPSAVRTEMLVTTDWLAQHIGDPHLVIIDVAKTRSGYDQQHIPGARLLLWDDLVTVRDGVPNEFPLVEKLADVLRRLGISDQLHIVLYDEEAGLSAARAYVTFDYLGLGEHTALLDGQWKKWRAEERPVSAQVPAVESSTFVPRLRPEVTVPLQVMQDLVWVKSQPTGTGPTIIDARPPEQYTGAEPGEGVSRPGHIPGAAGISWTKNIATADDPVLRPIDELRTLYAGAGVKPDEPVIVYCRTGVQAAHTYFTLRYLGYEAQLYDGSFIEWSKQPSLPVSKE